MPLLIFTIFIFVWYFPVWKRQGTEERLPRWTIAKSIAVGMVPVFLVIILLQVAFGFLQRALPLSPVAFTASDSYLSAALVEETVKFLGAYLVIRKVCPKRKVDYVLIFGAVGLGYEVTETLLLLDSVIAGLGRGIFALHIIWQFWMGMFYWEYRQAKLRGDRNAARKNLLLAFLIPVILHGTNDFLAFMAEKGFSAVDPAMLENFSGVADLSPELEAAGWWTAALLLFMAVEIVFQIITFRMALRTAKESRNTEISETEETAGEITGKETVPEEISGQ